MGAGTWNEAIRQAGLIPNTRGRTRGRIFYTTEGAYEAAVTSFVADAAALGRKPTSREYERWAAKKSVPSMAAIRDYFKSWSQAVRAGKDLSGSTLVSGRPRGPRADLLVENELLEVARRIEHSAAEVEAGVTPAEQIVQVKQACEQLAKDLVSDFESFRRQWIVAAASEDASAFVANLGAGGRASPKERKLWALMSGSPPAEAIPRVLDDRALDLLIGIPSGSVRDGGGWLGPAQAARLAAISLRDERLFRVLKAARNVIEHGSATAVKNLEIVLGTLDPVEDAPVLAGSSRLTSKDLVIRWLSAKSGEPPQLANSGAIGATRLGYLIPSVERIVRAMHSGAGSSDEGG
jgi:hypothetical protein